MSISRWFLYILLPAASIAPAGPVWAAEVLSISTAAEVMVPGSIPIDATDRFGSDTSEIHAVALVKGAKAGERFVGRWISMEAIATRDHLIAEADQQAARDGSARLHFTLSRPDKGWPSGNYRFELQADSQPLAQTEFAVIGPASAPAAAPGPAPASAANPLVAPEPAPASTSNPLAAPTPPVPVPLPAQAGSLVGYWQGEEGEVLTFDQSSYVLYEFNQLADLGSYSVSGNLLKAFSQLEDERSQYRFRLDGDTLLLEDGEGDVMRFYRLQQ